MSHREFKNIQRTPRAWSPLRNFFRPRRWHPRLSSWAILDNSPDLYSIVQLTPADIAKAIADCETNEQDPWDGAISSITAILYGVHFKPFLEDHFPINSETLSSTPGHFIAVLPCRICSDGIVAVPEEIQESLEDMRYTIRQDHPRNSKGVLSPVRDMEAPPAPSHPSLLHPPGRRLVVFGSLRFSLISERKFRRIGVPEFLTKIKRAFHVQGPGDQDRCTLVMTTTDLQQCGLFPHVTIEQVFDEYNPTIVTIEWSTLRTHVDNVAGADSLLWDLLISINDYETPEDYGYLLDLTKVQIDSGIVSQHQAVDPKRMEKAIRDVFTVRRNNSEGGISEEEGDPEQIILAEALKYALGLALNGVDPDYPRKIVGLGWTFNLLNQGDGYLIPYKRAVKSVSSVGYRVRKLSIWMWIAVILGCILPFVYIVVRSITADVPFEELINTGISLVALYIALVSPTLFQTVYRGERLTDVLSNMRNIDSQEEFEEREESGQHTDILEVIRIARRPPRFMGGQNMSYLRETRPEGLLDAKRPILFPNLELAGFALFENTKGELFLLDRWSRIFEVVIGRKVPSSSYVTKESSAPQSPAEPQARAQREDDPHSSTQSDIIESASVARPSTATKNTAPGQRVEAGVSPNDTAGSPLAASPPARSGDTVPGQSDDACPSPNVTAWSTFVAKASAEGRKTVPGRSGGLDASPDIISWGTPVMMPAVEDARASQPIVARRKAKSKYSGRTRSTGQAPKVNKYVDEEMSFKDTSGMGIYCHPVRQTVWLRVDHDRGRFKVKYVTTDGRKLETEITRVLPYRARMRRVEVHDWRQASVEWWVVIANADLLTMPIGTNIRDSAVGF